MEKASIEKPVERGVKREANSDGLAKSGPSHARLGSDRAKSSPNRASVRPNRAKPRPRHVKSGTDFARLIPYFARSAVVVVIIFVLSRVLPAMPAWVVAVALAALSLVPATGSVYRTVVNRTFDHQKKFGEGSIHKGVFRMRIAYFIGFYALSAVSVASILMESPTWSVGMWVTVILAVPLYVIVAGVAAWFVEKKEKAIPLVRDARAARFSVIATGVLLCVVFTVISFLQPAEVYAQAADAFMAAPKPFKDSPSALMRELGDLMALVGGLQSYSLAKLSETSWYGYLAIQVALNAAAMLGVAGMLSVCLVEPRELKRVFLVLEGDDDRGKPRPSVKSFCIVFVLLPLLLAGGTVYLDEAVSNPAQEGWYMFAKKIVRDQVQLVVYEIDGKYYDPDAVEEILAHAREASEALAREAEEVLVPLVNASFDARVANVDSYLDWYYGLFTDWEVLFNTMAAKNAEEYVKGQLVSHIEEGIDDSAFNDALKRYLEKCEALKADTRATLEQYEITTEYPSWLVEEAKPLEEQMAISLEPTEDFVNSCARVGINAGNGMGVWAAAKALAGVGINMALKKVDELLNREEYKRELVSAIEEQREETLAAVRSTVAAAASTAATQ